MNYDPPWVLIAAVSPHERRIVQSSLKKTGFTTLVMFDAEDPAAEYFANRTSSVLVIDSGLLEAAHDSQWRAFRARHPRLRTVVRCLIPRANGCSRRDSETLLVHPGDEEGMRQAVSALAATSGRPD